MVSVIVPTLNAEMYARNLLSSLSGQSVECEVIIVDSSSLDKTSSIVVSHNAKIVTVRKKDFNHGRTRNLGAQNASGNIVIFLTQDSLPYSTKCLEYLIKPLENSQIVASYARQIPRQDARPPETFARLFNYPDEPAVKGLDDLPELGMKTFFFSNVCSAIKTEEFKKLGGFPENILMFEDLIFAAKAILNGYKIAYVPEAKVWHSHKLSLVQQFQRYRDAGLSLRNNSWIFEHVKANKEGAKFLKREITYLLTKRLYGWVPYALVESIFKFSGYWLGLRGITSHERIINSSRSDNAKP